MNEEVDSRKHGGEVRSGLEEDLSLSKGLLDEFILLCEEVSGAHGPSSIAGIMEQCRLP